METMSNPGQWLMSYMHVSFQEIALKDFNRDVSFVDLDSIYAHMFDSIGFPAVVASCIVDSTGRVMRSSSQLDIYMAKVYYELLLCRSVMTELAFCKELLPIRIG